MNIKELEEELWKRKGGLFVKTDNSSISYLKEREVFAHVKLLVDVVKIKHKIFGGSFGWPYAIKKYATKNDLSWWDAFIVICNQIFSEN